MGGVANRQDQHTVSDDRKNRPVGRSGREPVMKFADCVREVIIFIGK
jgi:hypothetical protein